MTPKNHYKTVVYSLVLPVLLTKVALASEINFPDTFKIHQYNGEKVQSSFFNPTNEVKLKGNLHELVVSFEDVFEDEFNDTHTVINSEKFVVKFSYSGSKAIVVSTPKLQSEDDAFSFIRKPQLVLTGDNDTEVPHQSYWYKEIKTQTITDNYTQQTPVTVSANQQVTSVTHELRPVLATSVVQVKTSQGAEVQIKSEQDRTPAALDMLKFWWQQASIAERQQFLEHANKSN